MSCEGKLIDCDCYKRLSQGVEIHVCFESFVMKYLVFLILALFGCSTSSVELTDTIDPDIVIVNISDGDRAYIGSLIHKIDSCKPKLIVTNTLFRERKDSRSDLILENALQKSENVILPYGYKGTNNIVRSNHIFERHAKLLGALTHSKNHGVNFFTSIIQDENGQNWEHLAFVVASSIKPNLKQELSSNESIRIKYTRKLSGFTQIQSSELNTQKDYNILHNKIVLLGYIGPTDEDKYFTPMKETHEFPLKPDTYGIVVLANEIRMLLEMK